MVPPFLYDPIYPSLPQLSPFPLVFVRNACLSFLTTRLSSATSFYSASRISNVIIHPSANPIANLRSFVVEYFRLDARPEIILLFLLPFDFHGVMWNYVDSASRKRTRVVETTMGHSWWSRENRGCEIDEKARKEFCSVLSNGIETFCILMQW